MEKPIIFESTMMALVAEDDNHTSTPTSQDPPPNTNNVTGQMFSQQPLSDAHFCITSSPSTPFSVENCVEHPTDAKNDHHHDWWLVDLAAIQHKFSHTCALFCTFLETTFPPSQPAQQPSTPIADPINDDDAAANETNDDDSFWPHSHPQPVNLLALQWEIIQQTLSIQAFFQALALPNTDTIHSNTIIKSNDCLNTTPTSDEPTTAAYPKPSCIKPSTLYEYLSGLHTEESFIPAHLLHQIASPDFHTQSYQQQFMPTMNTLPWQNIVCKNTHVPISQHLSIPTLLTPSTDAD